MSGEGDDKHDWWVKETMIEAGDTNGFDEGAENTFQKCLLNGEKVVKAQEFILSWWGGRGEGRGGGLVLVVGVNDLTLTIKQQQQR